jgi:hypothetical protein
MSDPVLVAKMFLFQKSDNFTNEGEKQSEQVSLQAVYGTSPDDVNRKWAQATPSGQLQLSINNKAAHGLLKPGYYKVLLVPCGKDD